AWSATATWPRRSCARASGSRRRSRSSPSPSPWTVALRADRGNEGAVSNPIRVVLVEDNVVFREALELLLGLRGDIDVVGSVGDGGEAVRACAELAPDV